MTAFSWILKLFTISFWNVLNPFSLWNYMQSFVWGGSQNGRHNIFETESLQFEVIRLRHKYLA